MPINFEGYQADSQALIEQMPADAAIRDRLTYLTHDVGSRAVSAEIIEPQDGALLSIRSGPFSNQRNFFITNIEEISEQHIPETMRPSLKSVAFVSHITSQKNDIVSLMAMPTHVASRPLFNAMLAQHELTHATEPEAGLCVPGIPFSKIKKGIIERRASKVNADTIRAFDGTAFDEYAAFHGFKRGVFFKTIDQLSNDDPTRSPYRPPKDTFMEEAWYESARTRGMILGTSLVTFWEIMNWSKGEHVTNKIIGERLWLGK